MGRETFTASSFERTWAVIDGNGTLVFTDLSLGENLLAGYEVIDDMARARDPDVKALVTTGQVLTDGIQNLLDDGDANSIISSSNFISGMS